MERWTLKVGDMLIVAETRTGIITKVRSKSVQYFTSHSAGPGGFFNTEKGTVYESIDNGQCKHLLVGNTTKWRRRRKVVENTHE